MSGVLLGFIALRASLPAAAADGLCPPLQEFVASVKPGETRVLKFHTIWGSNFKDRDGQAAGAKRCDFGDYELAKSVCKYLMDSGSVDSPGFNAKAVISCVSPKTRFAAGTKLGAISFQMTVETDLRGSLVGVALKEDEQLGGVVLSISVTGNQ
ncbi:MAG: hypothetical protein WDO72_15155 [Pseudomonadota bacterium]